MPNYFDVKYELKKLIEGAVRERLKDDDYRRALELSSTASDAAQVMPISPLLFAVRLIDKRNRVRRFEVKISEPW
jgi:hypothetical protein